MLIQTTIRERIMVYGSYGQGKSFCWLDIAETYYQTGDRKGKGVKFYVIDSDFGVPKLLEEGYQHLEDCGMLNVYYPDGFRDMYEYSKEIRKKAKKGDWVVLDLADQGWSEAQRFYADKVYGQDPLDYYVQMRKEVVAKGGRDKRSFGGHEAVNWDFIHKIYFEYELPLTMKSKANVFAVTGEKKLDAEIGASVKQLREFAVTKKMAPTGQKGFGGRMDTVFRIDKGSNGKRILTMTKDKGRENSMWLDRKLTITLKPPPKAFCKKYLVDMVGWKIKGEKKSKPSKKLQHSTPTRRRK